ncbi:prepilin-type N-terminal cleavage/methylation domain-containing protein [Pedobacter cryoconitis]|uniref:prepilin-type N-terminal cleavage/methylation domain-containing protein n=1 Tax=Pedobacter cryoconitis TaxID=188932 RepID=UPI00161955D1|nr:prepilin-type N-terminal cleavage/methylation domain-containing protein [Pedobacter cryoconitis]MBB5649133.1 Tfp pilus assembly protein PilE [Pedobacter cryoconitis]
MKSKVHAFTLMEITVAMLISGLVITICYTAYGLIQGYYIRFGEKNKTSSLVLDLKHVLERDFFKAVHIIRTENGFVVQQDSLVVDYIFNDKQVLRQIESLHTDTFAMPVQKINFYFEGREAQITDTVDRINLELQMNKDTQVPIQVNKCYSSVDLFR